MVEEIVVPASQQGDELSNLPTVVVSGELDLAVAPWLHDQLEALFVGGADSIAVDLTGATFLDSTALGVLVGGLNQCQERGGRLHLIAPQRQILRVLKITGLFDVFTVHVSHDETGEVGEP